MEEIKTEELDQFEVSEEELKEIEEGIQTEFNEDGFNELVEEGEVENVYSEN